MMTAFSEEVKRRGSEIHKRCVFISTQDPTMLSAFDSEYIDKLLKGGVTCVNKMVAEPWPSSKERPFGEGVRAIRDLAKRIAVVGEERVCFIRSVEDIRKAKLQNKVGFIFGFQNARVIEDDIDNLTTFKELGVRIIQLTYQRRNFLADGGGEKTNCGLSEFGEEVVREMNRLGLLVDVSHVGYKSAMDAIEISSAPVIFSHSNAVTLCDNPRNIPDDLIKMVARKGGVVGVSMYTPLLKRGARPSLEDFLDHIEYISRLVGVDHVGIGLDYNYNYPKELFDYWQKLYPEVGRGQQYGDWFNTIGMESPEEWPNITKGLLVRGFNETETEKILGENFLRVFSVVWGR
jgi:membrane dipeptidase